MRAKIGEESFDLNESTGIFFGGQGGKTEIIKLMVRQLELFGMDTYICSKIPFEYNDTKCKGIFISDEDALLITNTIKEEALARQGSEVSHILLVFENAEEFLYGRSFNGQYEPNELYKAVMEILDAPYCGINILFSVRNPKYYLMDEIVEKCRTRVCFKCAHWTDSVLLMGDKRATEALDEGEFYVVHKDEIEKAAYD